MKLVTLCSAALLGLAAAGALTAAHAQNADTSMTCRLFPLACPQPVPPPPPPLLGTPEEQAAQAEPAPAAKTARHRRAAAKHAPMKKKKAQ